jgi:hypothetical protein
MVFFTSPISIFLVAMLTLPKDILSMSYRLKDLRLLTAVIHGATEQPACAHKEGKS